MRRIVGQGLVWLGLLLSGIGTPPAYAAEATPLQLFSALERSVVAVGEPFVFTAELYASPATEAEAEGISRAFGRSQFAEAHRGLELIRIEQPWQPERQEEDGLLVLRLVRQYVMRALRTGDVRLPALQFEYDGVVYATRPRTVTVYQVDRAFFMAGRSVLPLVAQHERGGRTYTRTGSGFFIGPDAIVTSYHIVVDARRVRIRMPDGDWVTTRRGWAVDPARDIAVLYLKPKVAARAGLWSLQLAPFKDAVRREEAAGDDVVFTYGWPGGLQRSTAGRYYQRARLHQHEARWVSSNPVRPGDSGGPLLDAWGRVLGVISSGTARRRSEDYLREEVSIATDPRPALGQRVLAGKPRSLHRLLRDPSVANQPYSAAFRLSALFAGGARSRDDLADALADLDAAVSKASGDPSLHFMRGAFHQVLGGEAAATAAYQDALQASSDFFPAAYMLAQHYFAKRDYEQAIRLFETTRRHRPYRQLAGYGLAQVYMQQVRYHEAAQQLRVVISYDPSFAPALYNLARCYLALEDETRARQLAFKLDHVAPGWAQQLRQLLRRPELWPVAVEALPRAPLPSPGIPF